MMSLSCLALLIPLNGPAVLVMCDVLNPDSSPHATNTRAKLVELLTPDVVAEKPMYGFEQVQRYSNPLCCRHAGGWYIWRQVKRDHLKRCL